MSVRDVDFKTYDGLKLVGTLYSAGEKRPTVIMTTGFSGARTQFIPDFAARFQAAGITVLAYDNRNLGDSEGVPRGEVDPLLQSRDYHDAFNFATTLPEVDADKIVYWGTSMSGGTAAYAAVLNKRLAGVILQVPYMSGEWVSLTAGSSPNGLIGERGHAVATGTPSRIPAFSTTTKAGPELAKQAVLSDPSSVPFTDEMTRRGWDWDEQVTVQSMAYCAMFEPLAYVHRISPTPLLMVVAGNDTTTPTHLQLDGFARAREPKTVRLFTGETHFSMYFGEPFERNIKAQIDWLKQTLGL
ncbi:Alpha/Beta hydrolase protein [Microdochium bolleyi]|uniref:Alpha/Beta hydrolase protein n=1 Tax=Microdochium bolleyi TaxID=196109 RepID=A0A136ISY1_9PEZI|nr:Alpha/Beta hydrolase protein [Microdochium bolleyi]